MPGAQPRPSLYPLEASQHCTIRGEAAPTQGPSCNPSLGPGAEEAGALSLRILGVAKGEEALWKVNARRL